MTLNLINDSTHHISQTDCKRMRRMANLVKLGRNGDWKMVIPNAIRQAQEDRQQPVSEENGPPYSVSTRRSGIVVMQVL